MAYANVDDVEKILPEGSTEDLEAFSEAEDRVKVNLEEATDLVIAFLEREYTEPDADGDDVPDDVPPAVRRVVARVTLRAFLDDPWVPGAESEVNLMGPFSHTINWSKEVQARDLYLTNADKDRLERFKTGYTGAVVHLPMAGACGTNWYAPLY